MRIKIIATGVITDAVQCDDTTVEVGHTGQRLQNDQYVIIDESDIIRSLRSMVPGVTLGLCIEPDDAERIWCNELAHSETKHFELFVERAPHGCDVNIAQWDDHLTRDIPWQAYAITASIVTFCLFALWGANHV